MAAQATAVRATRERSFYTTMAAVALVVVFVGFAPTYYLKKAFGDPPLTALVLVHGLVFSAWPILFLVQTRLVPAGRIRLHRRLGYAGAGLAVLMTAMAITTAIAAAKRGFAPPGGPPPLVFMAIPFGDITAFVGLCAAGIALRDRPETHKRLMLLATIALLTPAIARWPFVLALGPPAFFGLTDALLVVCAVHDRRRNGRVHSAFKWGSAWLVLTQPLRLAVAFSGPWLAFAEWATR